MEAPFAAVTVPSRSSDAVLRRAWRFSEARGPSAREALSFDILPFVEIFSLLSTPDGVSDVCPSSFAALTSEELFSTSRDEMNTGSKMYATLSSLSLSLRIARPALCMMSTSLCFVVMKATMSIAGTSTPSARALAFVSKARGACLNAFRVRSLSSVESSPRIWSTSKSVSDMCFSASIFMLAAVSSRAFDVFCSPFSLWNVRTFFGGSTSTSSLLSHTRLSASTLASCLAGISSPPSLTCRPARSRSSKCVSSTQMTRILYPQMISRSMASRKESLCTIRPWTCSSSMEDTSGGASSSIASFVWTGASPPIRGVAVMKSRRFIRIFSSFNASLNSASRSLSFFLLDFSRTAVLCASSKIAKSKVVSASSPLRRLCASFSLRDDWYVHNMSKIRPSSRDSLSIRLRSSHSQISSASFVTLHFVVFSYSCGDISSSSSSLSSSST